MAISYIDGGTGQICLHFCLWQKKRFRSVKPSRATVHRTVALNCSNLSVLFHQKENAHHLVCVFFLLLVYTLDIYHRNTVPARFVTFSFLWKEKSRFGSVEPSPATVHRTSAFNGSNLSVLYFSKEKTTCRNKSFYLFTITSQKSALRY